MTPEAAFFAEKAREFLAKSDSMMSAGWPDEAGRGAHLAGFHAAQALIFEREDDVPRTYQGVQTVFGRIGRTEPGLDRDLLRFLGTTYALKAVADYGTSPTARVTEAEARAAMAGAARLVEGVAAPLGPLDDAAER